MLRASLCVVTARKDRRLVGIGRAWGDGCFRAVIDDFVVVPPERGKNVGTRIVKMLLTRLATIEEVSLSTGLAMAPFYARLGFVLSRGAHMKRIAARSAQAARVNPRPGIGSAHDAGTA